MSVSPRRPLHDGLYEKVPNPDFVSLLLSAKKAVWNGNYAEAIDLARQAAFETSQQLSDKRITRVLMVIWRAIRFDVAERRKRFRDNATVRKASLVENANRFVTRICSPADGQISPAKFDELRRRLAL